MKSCAGTARNADLRGQSRQSRMAQVAGQGAGEPGIVEHDVAPLIDAKANALVEPQRAPVMVG